MFQSIRIEVNKEIEVLQEFLLRTAGALKPGGRFVIMTYHSLEDRPVKNYLKTGNFQGKEEKDVYGNLISPFELVNRKVIIPSDEELEKNPRSRSAKLRIAERTVY
jgi:16S rRNA (cytosine1402-N4)-methyltransferase